MNNYRRDLRKEPRYFSKRQMGGGSVMVWAAFCVKGKSEIAFINGRLNSEGYQTMLENFLIPMMENWPENDFVFQQDNAAIHISNSTKQWFAEHYIDIMAWPARSPDLNPIENLWGILVRDVYADCRQFENVRDLKIAIRNAWNRISNQTLANLVGSMQNRMTETLKMRGNITKY